MAFDSAGILLRIKAEGGKATAAEIKAIENAVQELKTGTASAADSVGTSATAITGSFNLVKTGALAVGAGIAAVAAAAVATTGVLLALSKSTAEFGSTINDAKDKTGLGAERLSALKLAADSSGSSFEELTRGISTFGVEVGKAALGNDKAQAKMKLLKVSSDDLNTALGQAVKTIFDAKDGTEQLALADAAFGRELGAKLIPVIKETHGNLDEFTKKAKELGVTMDDAGVRSAERYAKQLDILHAQLAGVGRAIGTEFIPVFIDMFRTISEWLSRNQGEIKRWADNSAVLITGLIAFWGDLSRKVQEYADIVKSLPLSGEVGQGLLAAALGPAGPAIDALLERGRQAQRARGVQAEAGGTIGGQVDAESEAEIEKRRRERERAAEEYRQSLSKINALMLREARETFKARQEADEDAFKRQEISAGEYAKKTADNFLAYKAQAQQILEKNREIDLFQAKNAADRQAAELEYNNALKGLLREQVREREDARKNIEAADKKATAEQLQRERELEAERKKAAADEKRDLDEFIEKSERLYEIELNRLRIEEEREQFRTKLPSISDVIDPTTLLPPEDEGGIFAPWLDSWNEFFERVTEDSGTLSASISTFAGTLQNAFQGVAHAIGSVIQQWVLYGKTGPAVMRQILAAALASIAAEAAVRAIEATALGFFRLAQHDYPAATAAFTSAAFWAAVATASAVAGRLVAGNSFNRETATATGSSGAGAGGNRDTEGQGRIYSRYGDDATIIETGRQDPRRGGLLGRIEAHFQFRFDDRGMVEIAKQHIENGGLRQVVIDTAAQGT